MTTASPVPNPSDGLNAVTPLLKTVMGLGKGLASVTKVPRVQLPYMIFRYASTGSNLPKEKFENGHINEVVVNALVKVVIRRIAASGAPCASMTREQQ